jgi:hypothetical protein
VQAGHEFGLQQAGLENCKVAGKNSGVDAIAKALPIRSGTTG